MSYFHDGPTRKNVPPEGPGAESDRPLVGAIASPAEGAALDNVTQHSKRFAPQRQPPEGSLHINGWQIPEEHQYTYLNSFTHLAPLAQRYVDGQYHQAMAQGTQRVDPPAPTLPSDRHRQALRQEQARNTLPAPPDAPSPSHPRYSALSSEMEHQHQADQSHTIETSYTRFRYDDNRQITKDDLIQAFLQLDTNINILQLQKNRDIRYSVRSQGMLTDEECNMVLQALREAYPHVQFITQHKDTKYFYKRIQPYRQGYRQAKRISDQAGQ